MIISPFEFLVNSFTKNDQLPKFTDNCAYYFH